MMNEDQNQGSPDVTPELVIFAIVVVIIMIVLVWYKESGYRWAAIALGIFFGIPAIAVRIWTLFSRKN